ncbi:hypothetical protein F4804DRAFT_215807 [Jackrogersella minutella]|nr:hypothetical protein F4804DRAFT_215807 [Jackrogersella minutella]
MAPKISDSKGINLTTRDMEILSKAWQCFEGSPKLDWQKLADIAPFKNAATARACFLPIKKKLATAAGESSTADSGEPSTPVKVNGKRKSRIQKTPGSGKKAKSSGKPSDHFSFADDDEEDHVKPKIGAEGDVDIKAEFKSEEEVDGDNSDLA